MLRCLGLHAVPDANITGGRCIVVRNAKGEGGFHTLALHPLRQHEGQVSVREPTVWTRIWVGVAVGPPPRLHFPTAPNGLRRGCSKQILPQVPVETPQQRNRSLICGAHRRHQTT